MHDPPPARSRSSAFLRSRALVLPLALSLFLLVGCASLGEMRERPEALEPVPVEAPPRRAYDEALTMAFDRGYNIAYANDEERLIELDALDRRLVFPDRVRRIDLFVRERQGQTYVHARVHSFESGDPNDIDVRDEDREAARRLIDALVARLEGRAPGRDKTGAL